MPSGVLGSCPRCCPVWWFDCRRPSPPLATLRGRSSGTEDRWWLGDQCPHCPPGMLGAGSERCTHWAEAGWPQNAPMPDGAPLPSVEEVIQAAKAAVPPIHDVWDRLHSPSRANPEPAPASAATVHDVLRVTVQEARDLWDNRGQIKGDLYVRLTLGTMHNYETSVAWGTARPQWHESFCLDMGHEDGDGLLEVRAFDRDPDGGTDYEIGALTLDLYALHPRLVASATVESELQLTNQVRPTSSVWTRHRAAKQGQPGGSVGTTSRGKGRGCREVRIGQAGTG